MNDPYKVLNVSPDASDDEVKRAYRDLARKYHPDNYHDNPLADLAQEKMKEINEAYETIQKQRKAGSASSRSYGSSAYGGYGSYRSGGGGRLARVRAAISQGNITLAEQLLNAESQHDAEWNFLMGNVCYRRGWMDEAKRYFETACRMEPNNGEYRKALNVFNAQGYRPAGFEGMSTGCASDDMCSRLCMSLLCCNLLGGGGCYFFPCFI